MLQQAFRQFDHDLHGGRLADAEAISNAPGIGTGDGERNGLAMEFRHGEVVKG